MQLKLYVESTFTGKITKNFNEMSLGADRCLSKVEAHNL